MATWGGIYASMFMLQHGAHTWLYTTLVPIGSQPSVTVLGQCRVVVRLATRTAAGLGVLLHTLVGLFLVLPFVVPGAVLQVDQIHVDPVPIAVDPGLDADAPHQAVHVLVLVQLVLAEAQQVLHGDALHLHAPRGHMQQLQIVQRHEHLVPVQVTVVVVEADERLERQLGRLLHARAANAAGHSVQAGQRTINVLRVTDGRREVAAQQVHPQPGVVAPEAATQADAPQETLGFGVVPQQPLAQGAQFRGGNRQQLGTLQHQLVERPLQ
uniref:Uncharacterized protein n=1 Tax=Anopheles atroparvus TaxID=41427 RepID=A0A182JHT6_ANOAO